MPTDSTGMQKLTRPAQQSHPLIQHTANADGRDATTSAHHERRSNAIFPTETSASAKCCFFSVVTEPPQADQTSPLPLIQTFDVNKKVDSSMRREGLSKSASNQETLLLHARQATNAEVPFVASQLATLKVLMESSDPSRLARVLAVVDKDGESSPHVSRLAAYLDTKGFDSEKGIFVNDSGLKKGTPETFCPMPQDRHVIMRAMDIVQTNFAGRTVTGKPYAEYLVAGTEKGERVFPAGQDEEEMSKEQYAQLFGTQSNFSFYAHMAVQKDGMENLEALIREQPHLAGSDLSSADFAKAKPHLVVTATPSESVEFVSRCHFPNKGEWHIELPPKVLDQLQYSEKHALDDPEKLQKFIFVQEMGTGNILLSVHLDTTFHHSTPLAGVPVETAGELDGHLYKDTNGKYHLKVQTYVNKSGHYHPSLASMAALRDTLIQSGLDPKKVEFKAISRDPVVLGLLKEWNNSAKIPSRLPDFMANTFSQQLNQKATDLRQTVRGDSRGFVSLISKNACSSPALAASDSFNAA